MFDVNLEGMTPQKPDQSRKRSSAVVRDFFGRSQLSQFMDQIESVGGIDAQAPSVRAWAWRSQPRPRRIRSARRSPFALRSHLSDRDTGRSEYWTHQLDVVPLRALTEFGFIETPYRKIVKGVVKKDDRISYRRPGGKASSSPRQTTQSTKKGKFQTDSKDYGALPR